LPAEKDFFHEVKEPVEVHFLTEGKGRMFLTELNLLPEIS
jgi:hypothetical protein